LQALINATENEESIMGCLKQISVKDIAYGQLNHGFNYHLKSLQKSWKKLSQTEAKDNMAEDYK
jgi:hypothetical protein